MRSVSRLGRSSIRTIVSSPVWQPLRRPTPLEHARSRYRHTLAQAAEIAAAHDFPGGALTASGEFYLDVRGLAVYYNISDPNSTPGDGQSLDIPSGRETTPLEIFVLDTVPSDGIYLDVGANNGFFYALQMARRHSAARIYAFEPDPQILPHLERNVRRNGFEDRVEIVAQAVSNRSGRARLTAGFGASGYLLAEADPDPGIEVDVTTIDAFAHHRRLDRVDLVKVDIEGHEEAMLEGSREVLEAFRPILVIELSDPLLRRAGSSRSRVRRMLSQAGYSTYHVLGSADTVAFPNGRGPEPGASWLARDD